MESWVSSLGSKGESGTIFFEPLKRPPDGLLNTQALVVHASSIAQAYRLSGLSWYRESGQQKMISPVDCRSSTGRSVFRVIVL